MILCILAGSEVVATPPHQLLSPCTVLCSEFLKTNSKASELLIHQFQASKLLTPVPGFQDSKLSDTNSKLLSLWNQFQASEINFEASELLGPIPLSSKFLNTSSKLPSFWYTNCNLPSFWYTNFKASKPLIPIPSLQGCWYQLSSSQALWYRFSSLQAFWYQFSSSQAFWYLPDVLLIWFLQVRWICVFKE